MTRPAVRRRVPTILQQEAAECGAACLAMVLAYHGHWASLEDLRELCGVSRDGSKASNVLKAARAHGLLAKGLRKEPDELAALPLPLIVFWNFNHFVVVEGIDRRGGVWLNDPASGRRRITRAEFDGAFTGVVLAFEPGDTFAATESRPGLPRLIAMRVAGHWRGLAAAIVAGTLLIVPGLVTVGFTRLFIDGILIQGNRRWLVPLLLAMVATGLLRGALQYMLQRLLARAQAAMATTLAARQMWAMLTLPLGFFAQRFPGEITNRFMMVDRFAGLLTAGLIPALIAAITLVAYGMALLMLDPVMGLVGVTIAVLAVAMLWIASRGLEDAGRRMVADDARLQAATIQGVGMAEDFRAAGTEGAFVARWAGYQARVRDAEQRSTFRTNILSQVSAAAVALGGVAVLVIGGTRVIDGAVSIGVLVAFQMLMGNFFAPLAGLVGFGGQVQMLRGIGERLDDIALYAAATKIREVTPCRVPPGAELDLVLRDVAFGYAPLEGPFIQDVTLRIPAGARVALVGASGSGKSTLGRLMVGLVAPNRGTIELGGVALEAWPKPEISRRIAYVDQIVGLFEASVQDNITLWDSTLSEERVVTAAQQAMAHDFITARPEGYAARLSENGGNLSGGERQRLAIARALATDPSVIVLDEATSALDPISEQKIMDVLRRRGCTTIIIAHRLSTIRDCENIIVLNRGRIVEQGTHQSLLERKGAYGHLVEH